MRVCPKCRAVYMGESRRCAIDGYEITERDTDPLLGEKLDRYVIRERLGSGTMGAIYRAEHESLARQYAIQVLFGDFAANAAILERFRREALALSRVRHAHVVDVVDFGRSAAGLAFIALDMLEGETLAQIIERESPIHPERVARLTLQAAAGLAALHAHDLVHRDVKPAHLMVTREGREEHLKVLDFGTVSVPEPASEDEGQIAPGGPFTTTPTYMAPEQTHESSITPAADLYALGVVAFEMLKGLPPFSGRTRADVLIQHLSKRPPALPDCQGLEPIVFRLLQKKPKDRFPSADALREALEAHLERSRRVARGKTPPPVPLERVQSLVIEAELAEEFGLDPSRPRQPALVGAASGGPRPLERFGSAPMPAHATQRLARPRRNRLVRATAPGIPRPPGALPLVAVSDPGQPALPTPGSFMTPKPDPVSRTLQQAARPVFLLLLVVLTVVCIALFFALLVDRGFIPLTLELE